MKLLNIVGSVCILALTASTARSQVNITPTVTPNVGISNYAYSIQNLGPIGILSLSIAIDGQANNLNAPAGWVGNIFPVGDTTSIDWLATDTPYIVLPGATLSGFSFDSTPTVGSIPYSVMDNGFNTFSGTTFGPVASAANVPEANPIVELGLGLLLLLPFLSKKVLFNRTANTVGSQGLN